MLACLNASINDICNIFNLSGSDFVAIGNLSSIIFETVEYGKNLTGPSEKNE